VPDAVCDQCQEPLIEIDRYGERLIGCVVCNRWGWPGDKNLIMELSDEDIAALKGSTMKAVILALGVLASTPALAEPPALAESICVKYGPCPLDVSTFACTDITSNFIRRICYDEPRSFMVIKLNETWYSYCEIDAATVQKLITARSAG
jgi:hypothetical protein